MNIHIYHSNLTHETRINKVTSSLVESGLCSEIEIIGKYGDGLKSRESLDPFRTFVRIKTFFKGNSFVLKAISFLEWYVRTFFYLLKKDIEMINAHSLTVLPLAVYIGLLKKSKIIYEPHELETESSGKGPRLKKIFKYLEKTFISQADLVYTVGEDISEHYKENYALDTVHTILNVPEYDEDFNCSSNILRTKLKLKKEPLLFIYQGLMTEARGVIHLLECFSQLDDKRHLVMMGYGPLEDTIREFSIKHNNIHYIEAVPQNEIIEYTSSADVGICYLTDDCLSYRLSLPNKLFEYMHSGIPVVINDIQTSSKKLLESFDCGFIVNNNAKELISCIIEVERADINRKSKNILELRQRFSWSQENKKLIEIYKNSLKDG